MSNKNLKIEFANTSHTVQVNADGLYDLKGIEKAWKAAGKKGGELRNWLRNEQVSDLVERSQIEIIKNRGQSGGTWGCEDAVNMYASWTDQEFNLNVIRSLRAYKATNTQIAEGHWNPQALAIVTEHFIVPLNGTKYPVKLGYPCIKTLFKLIIDAKMKAEDAVHFIIEEGYPELKMDTDRRQLFWKAFYNSLDAVAIDLQEIGKPKLTSKAVESLVSGAALATLLRRLRTYELTLASKGETKAAKEIAEWARKEQDERDRIDGIKPKLKAAIDKKIQNAVADQVCF